MKGDIHPMKGLAICAAMMLIGLGTIGYVLATWSQPGHGPIESWFYETFRTTTRP
jgi:hypothetical protein